MPLVVKSMILKTKIFEELVDLFCTSQVALVVKNLSANAGDVRGAASIPEKGESSGGGHVNPLQYSCQENPMDR